MKIETIALIYKREHTQKTRAINFPEVKHSSCGVLNLFHETKLVFSCAIRTLNGGSCKLLDDHTQTFNKKINSTVAPVSKNEIWAIYFFLIQKQTVNENLLVQANLPTLYNRRLQDIAIRMFKAEKTYYRSIYKTSST